LPFELTQEDLSMQKDRNDSVLHQLCKVEQTLILKKALESPALSDKCRQLIKDYYYTTIKITLKKIAEQNEETEEAVRKRKMDCLLKLQAILIKMGFKDVHLLNENFD
jgi:hypothetical protein